MNEHPDNDLQTELAALRQRLGDLEAEHRERQATRSRRPAFSRTFLLCALPVTLVLATAGLLYAVDALFINQDGNVGIGTSTANNRLTVNGSASFGGTASNTGCEQVEVQGSGAGYSLYDRAGGASERWVMYSNRTGGAGTNTLRFWSNGEDKAAITSGGNLKVNGVLEGIGAVPPGAILMWSGKVDQLPKGWVLCDGTNNTPNLKGRFIVGYDPGDTDYSSMQTVGGLKNVTLTQAEMGGHSHAVTQTGGAVGTHKHTYGGFPTTQADANVPVYGPSGVVTSGWPQPQAHENRPPYMVLAYIMYTGKKN